MHIDAREVVFATVPYTNTSVPLMAPAILKSIAIKAGKTCATVDLNILARQLIDRTEHQFEIINFFHDGVANACVDKELFDLHMSFAQRILAYQPKIVGLSVFTYNCQISAKYTAFFIKKLSPNTKVLLGGAGLNQNLIGYSKFAEGLVKNGLIDFYIRGDGENALYEYLINEDLSIPGINDSAWKELSNQDLAMLPPPDYDDYDFDNYATQALPVVGSRGCVRNCSFCDIHAHWTKFSWRTGQHIFDEMLLLSRKYNVYSFMFQDSLINGNLKEYRILMRLIADHNRDQPPEHKFVWSSFFILRPINNFTEEDWKLTAEGGGLHLLVGIETFNDEARFHLGKKFTNEDIEFGLQMAKKYGIKMIFLFLIGYITESDADNEFAIKWWEDHVEYRDVIEVNLGSPLGILNGTPLEMQFESLGLKHVGTNDQDWVNPATDNTPAKRVIWYQNLSAALKRLGFTELVPTDNRFILERMLRDFR
jgi:radical SAM superfamily enzyme YgiQ (UPF0313 family)